MTYAIHHSGEALATASFGFRVVDGGQKLQEAKNHFVVALHEPDQIRAALELADNGRCLALLEYSIEKGEQNLFTGSFFLQA